MNTAKIRELLDEIIKATEPNSTARQPRPDVSVKARQINSLLTPEAAGKDWESLFTTHTQAADA